jgi:hypothetical protein
MQSVIGGFTLFRKHPGEPDFHAAVTFSPWPALLLPKTTDYRFFSCAITSLQGGGVLEDMLQEDGGHVIESWRVALLHCYSRVHCKLLPSLHVSALIWGPHKENNEYSERNT